MDPIHEKRPGDPGFDPVSAGLTASAENIPECPSLEDVRDAVSIIFSSGMEDYGKRLPAMRVLEAANWNCPPEVYGSYYPNGLDLSEDEVREMQNKYPVLYFYEAAFDKVTKELEDTAVAPGEAVLWLIYNLGYVVKTSESCFALDLHHRRSEELAEKLDFLLVTHNHSDHSTDKLLKAMKQLKKPIVSNFFPAPGYTAENTTLEFGRIKIHTTITDHNSILRRFVQTYEIETDPDKKGPVIFIGGDSCDPKQFQMRNPKVDAFLVHPRVGLNVAEAQKIIDPDLTLISHLHEMGHAYDLYRWPYAIGFCEIGNGKLNGRHCAMPLWGDRIRLAAR